MMRPRPVPLALFRTRHPPSSLFHMQQTPLPLKTVTSQTCRHSSSLPEVLRPEFWKGMVPRALRRDGGQEDGGGRGAVGSTGNKEKNPLRRTKWNPATYFICMFMLIGSMSIHMISLRRELEDFMRRTNVRIEILREAVEAVQRGEKVDIAEVLGTGDPASEKEWEEVLKQIEHESAWKDSRRIRQPGVPHKQQQPTATSEKPATTQEQQQQATAAPTASTPPPKPSRPVFY